MKEKEDLVAEARVEERSKEELQKIVDEGERFDHYSSKFALKWVERVVFWVIIAFTTSVVGVIITNILSEYLHSLSR